MENGQVHFTDGFIFMSGSRRIFLASDIQSTMQWT